MNLIVRLEYNTPNLLRNIKSLRLTAFGGEGGVPLEYKVLITLTTIRATPMTDNEINMAKVLCHTQSYWILRLLKHYGD